MRRPLWFTAFVFVFLAVLAGCQAEDNTLSSDAQATIQALVGTQLAQQQSSGGNSPAASPAPDYPATIAAQGTQIGVLQNTLAAPAPTTAPPPTPAPSPTPDDTTALRNALAAFLAWPPSEVEFDIGENTGTFARGSVKHVNEEFGGWWFAAKVEGVWMIAGTGNGVPECERFNALNIPVQWVDYCMDGDNTVKR